LLGWEREVNVHNAGLRTNTLVAVGSALFTIVSAYGFLAFTKYQHIQIDPTRIASYVVAGIGFALFILIGLRYIEAYWLPGRSQHQRVIKIRFQSQEDDGEVIGKIYGILNNNHADIETMQILKEANQDCVLNVHCHILQDKDLTLVVNDLRMLHNLKEVEVALRKGALTRDADV
jgi:putative Mg2+ transporter-C (MgtC) family protein